MKKIKFITKALAALTLITAVSATNADAQIGKNLLNKAKQAGKEIIQGSDSQQSNQQQSQQPAQQQQNSAPQQNNNQTAQPSQQANKPAAKPNTPAEKPKQYTKADYTAETQQLVGKVDSASHFYDIIRVYAYLYRRTESALDTKDYDFLVDSFSYFDDVWDIVAKIGDPEIAFGDFDKRYYAEDAPKEMKSFVSNDYFTVKSNHKFEAPKLANRVKEILVVPTQLNICDYIEDMLKKGETCKSANARAKFLKTILDARNKYTSRGGYLYPTDEKLFTERLKTFASTIPQEIADQMKIPQVYNAEEIRNLRLEYVKEHLSNLPSIPKSRDAALEAKVKQQILKENPDAKVRMVLIASDATADWLVKKNGVGVPTRRIKDGWIIVECPGFPGIGGMYKIYPEQQYIGGGKYGASSASFSLPSISDKMIYTNDNCGGVLTQCWSFCKL